MWVILLIGVKLKSWRIDMTKEETKERIKVMQAYVDGRQIQIKNDDGDWRNIVCDPCWGIHFEYRIKPEPKYSPFKDAEECWQEMQKHQPFGWLKDSDGNFYQVVSMGGVFMGTVNPSGKIISKTYYDFYFVCSFVDGTPFGIKVEE